jgi:hypothetical protein
VKGGVGVDGHHEGSATVGGGRNVGSLDRVKSRGPRSVSGRDALGRVEEGEEGVGGRGGMDVKNGGGCVDLSTACRMDVKDKEGKAMGMMVLEKKEGETKNSRLSDDDDEGDGEKMEKEMAEVEDAKSVMTTGRIGKTGGKTGTWIKKMFTIFQRRKVIQTN